MIEDSGNYISLSKATKIGWTDKFAYLGSPALALAVANGVDEPCVIPIFYHIIRAIMDFNFYGVPTIVNQENNGLLPTSDHC